MHRERQHVSSGPRAISPEPRKGSPMVRLLPSGLLYSADLCLEDCFPAFRHSRVLCVHTETIETHSDLDGETSGGSDTDRVIPKRAAPGKQSLSRHFQCEILYGNVEKSGSVFQHPVFEFFLIDMHINCEIMRTRQKDGRRSPHSSVRRGRAPQAA